MANMKKYSLQGNLKLHDGLWALKEKPPRKENSIVDHQVECSSIEENPPREETFIICMLILHIMLETN